MLFTYNLQILFKGILNVKTAYHVDFHRFVYFAEYFCTILLK